MKCNTSDVITKEDMDCGSRGMGGGTILIRGLILTNGRHIPNFIPVPASVIF
jgi:hypothetical protein